MRQKSTKILEVLRAIHPVLGPGKAGETWGYFEWGPVRIVSGGLDSEWEHVSASLTTRCPTWVEMCFIKNLFWEDTETVLQFHPRTVDYINVHPFTLHLWKRVGQDHELPPAILI